jgi:SNF2 family DNA or RNA helicase
MNLEETRVGKRRRVLVKYPFSRDTNDKVKAAGGMWDGRGKKWTIARTPLAVREFAWRMRHAGYDLTMTDELQRLSEQPVNAGEIKMRSFDQSILKPWNHQAEGASMIGQLHGSFLAWDMGSGKTKTLYDAIIEFGGLLNLVLCPASVVSVWGREHAKHARNLVTICELSKGSVAQRIQRADDMVRHSLQIKKPLLIAVNYEAARMADFVRWACAVPWWSVTCDESQRIANRQSKTCKAACVIGDHAEHRVCLTGTPISNDVSELFGQYLFCDEGVLGTSWTRFVSEHVKLNYWGAVDTSDGDRGVKDEDALLRKINRVTTKVRISDVVDLPEYRDEQVDVTLDAEERRVYTQVREDFISEVGAGVVTASNALVKLLRMQQATGGFTKIETPDGESREVDIGRSKSDRFGELLSEMPHREPVVVFCKFVRDMARCREEAIKLEREVYELSGRYSEQRDWEAACSNIGPGKRAPVLVVQIQAGGVGIDLTKAAYCVYYSLGFSYQEYRQSRARVHRPGQSRPVIYYHMVAENSVDEIVYAALDGKEDVVEYVMRSIVKAGMKQDAG